MDLSVHSINLAGQFDIKNEGITNLFTEVDIPRGVHIKTSIATGELAADISHKPGEQITESELKMKTIDLGEIGFYATMRKTSPHTVQAQGRNAAIEELDNRMIGLVNNHIETKLMSNLVTLAEGGKEEAEELKMLLAMMEGELLSKTEFVGSEIVAIVNTKDFYEYLGSADLTVQTLFGMTYIKGFLGYHSIILSNKLERGQAVVTYIGNLQLAYVDMNGETFEGHDLITTEGGIVGFKYFIDDKTGDTYSKVHFAIDSFPARADGVVTGTLVDPVEPVSE